MHRSLQSTAPCSWGWWTGVLLLTTVQIQAGWLQHDFGHLSVFKSSRLNHIAHWFVICQSVAETVHSAEGLVKTEECVSGLEASQIFDMNKEPKDYDDDDELLEVLCFTGASPYTAAMLDEWGKYV